MNKKIRVNIGLQTIYQILNTCLPLFTAPYLARVLGAVQQGVFSYTQSIVNYFVLFAMLGITNHGTRYIAERQSNKEERGKAFINIYLIQLVASILMSVLYVVYIIGFCSENRLVALMQILAIIACIFDINWFFFGIEAFEITVSRNIIIRLFSVFLIFFLVREQRDLWIYTLLMVGSTLINNVVLWFYLPKYIKFSSPNFIEIRKNLKPIIVLFVPILGMSIYHVMDKTMLGLLSDYENCGYYYNADKIINIPMGIISGISTVLFPRMVIILNEKSKEEFSLMFSKCMEGIILVSVAMMFGIAAVSNEFVPLFFGPGFESCITLIIVLAPIMIIKSVSTTIRYQFLIPNNQENVFMISVFVGAFVNVISNWICIPKLGAMGAVIGTLLAELTACVIQIIFVQRQVNLFKVFKDSLPYVVMGLLMYICVRLLADCFFVKGVLLIIFEVFVGGFVFGVESLLYWRLVKKKTVLNKLLRSFKR